MKKGVAKKAILLAAISVVPALASAQSNALDAITGNASPTTATLVTSYEQFGITNVGTPITLHYKNISPLSEMVSLNNQGLTRNTDYTINYMTGTLYVLRAVNPGQIIRISYQHATVQSMPMPSLPGPTSVGGSSSLAGAMGVMPQLDSDQPKQLSLNTSGGIGNTQSNGVMILNGISAAQTPGGLTTAQINQPDGNAMPVQSTGGGNFVLENLTSAVGKGKISLDYQDISSNFHNYNAVASQGYGDNINSLERESGLKRMGVAMQGIDVGSVKISDDFRTVSDGNGKISWANFALDSGPFQLKFDQRNISSGFSRFADLGESDRDTLMREAGLNRQDIGLQYKTKTGGFGFSSQGITDETGQRILKQDFNINTPGVKLDMGTQSVGQNFVQFDSLTDAEQKDYSTQAGMGKKWLNLETAPIGKGGQPLKISAEDLTSPNGNYQSVDASVGGKNWTAQVADRKMSNGFGMYVNLPDAQLDQDVQAIAKMYSATGLGTGPGDRSVFLSGANIDRSAFRFTLTPKKDQSFDLEEVSLKGSQDGAYLQTLTANTKNFTLTAHNEHVGQNFVEQPFLMGFEQQRFGPLLGVDKYDASGAWGLGGAKKLTFGLMDAKSTQGDARRDSVEYSDKRIDLSYASRDTSTGFGAAGQLSDPEAGLLSALNGFRDEILQGKWQPSAKLNIQGMWEQQHNQTSGQSGYDKNIAIIWDPNKTTHFAYNYAETKSDNPLAELFDNRLSSLLFSKDFGKYGKFQYIHQDTGIADPNGAPPPAMVGPQTPGVDPNLPQGNASEDQVTYNVPIDKLTNIQTQESRTTFANGQKEQISANTINRTITPRFGVSYTNLNIDRPGNNNDENKNNYGFWFDLAKGVRFSYGFVRDLNQLSGNTSNTTIGVTPGTLGAFKINTATYGANSWDQLHNQVTSNFALSSSKPFSLGFIKDAQFNLGMNTASDYSIYSTKNELANFSGKIGGTSFMLEYKTQMDAFHKLGTDKFLSIQTDSNPKKWIEGSIKVKERDDPENGITMIRDYSITLRPLKNLEITNHVLTNPEMQFRPDVPMGSVTSPWQMNTYKLDYHASNSTSIGATWDERRNGATGDYYHTAGLDLELFKNTKSPLTLWYGLEQGGGPNTPHQFAQRFYLKYYQQPGPNQVFNIFLGNIAYAYTNPTLLLKNNWTIQGDYEYRFWTGLSPDHP